MPNAIWMVLVINMSDSSGLTQHDEALERLLNDLSKTIADNRKFLKGLKEDSIDKFDQNIDDDEVVEEVAADEIFEEL